MFCLPCAKETKHIIIQNDKEYDELIYAVYGVGQKVLYADTYTGVSEEKKDKYAYIGFCSIKCFKKFLNKYKAEVVLAMASGRY